MTSRMNRRRALFIALALLTLTALLAAPAAARFGRFLFAGLSGFSEVPAVLSTGHGAFKALLRHDDTIEFDLAYRDLVGTPVQAHIHFGQKDVNGAVVAFLCGGPTPPCGPDGASGTLDAASVTAGAAAQGIAAGDFDGLLAAIRSGNAYVNVHTDVFPTGEIRGQIR